jgi:hypothetical protein
MMAELSCEKDILQSVQKTTEANSFLRVTAFDSQIHNNVEG